MALRGAMDRAALDAFLSEPIRTRIATVRGDRPHVVPMWFDAIIRLRPARIDTWDDTRTGLAPSP